MANKRKVTTAIVAAVTAISLLIGGTFAWQSINQTALNEASDVINPGGRLHDDFDGSNKDVYVENFADEDIFARIQLSEYFEIVLNHGTAGEKPETIIGSKNEDGSYNYEPYLFDANANGDGTFNAGIDATDANPYWIWTTGGETVFMPTFNMNKDSLAADINGIYEEGNIGAISNRDGTQYTEYTEYTEGDTKTGNAIYDIDPNMADELAQGGVDIADLIANGNLDAAYEDSVALVEEIHNAKSTGNGTLISMTEWLDMVEADGGYNAADHGNYWVYDTDGWVYWSAPIASGEATGLLLDGIELNQVMDDTWYYAINVVAQFVTAGDTGSLEDGTGFYDTANGSVPSDNALTLLDKIGVNDTTPGSDAGDEEIQTLILTTAGDNEVYISYGDSVKLEGEDGADLSSIRVDGDPWTEDSDWTYDPDTGILTLNGSDSYYDVSDANGTYSGTVYFEGGNEEIQTLILTTAGDDEVYISYGEDVKIEGDEGADMSSIKVDSAEWTEDSDWTYDSDTGILTLNGSNESYTISDANGNYSGTVYVEYGNEELQTLRLTEAGDNEVTIAHGEDVKIEGDEGADLSSILVDGAEQTDSSDWIYYPETGILTLSGYETYYEISDASGDYTGTVYFEDGAEDYDYSFDLYASAEDYDAFTGDSSHIKPNEKYYIYAVADEDPSQYEEEGYAVDITLRAEDRYGEEVTLTPGVDYELTPGAQFEEVPYFTSSDHEEGEKEWCYRAELTILNEELLADWLYVEVKAPRSSEAQSSWIIQEMVTEATIVMYESEGDHNRVTTTLLQPNTYYDIMVEVGGIVIYDSCHPDRVDPNISYTGGMDGAVTVSDYEGTAEITEDGQLFTGENPGLTTSSDPDSVGGFMVSLDIYDLRIPASSDQEEETTHAYATGNTPWLFEYGKAPISVVIWSETNTIFASDGKSETGVDFAVFDYADTSIADKVNYTITGNTDENTTVEVSYSDIDFEYVPYLKLGAAETSTELTIEVSAPGYITETVVVNVDYTVTE